MKDISIAMTIGNRADLVITTDNHLFIAQPGKTQYDPESQVDLGLFTKQRVEQLQYYLERLKVHAL